MRESWLDSLIDTPDARRADLAEGIALAVSETIHAEANRVRAVREACAKQVRAALAQSNGTRRRDVVGANMSIRLKMVCNQASDGRIVLQVVTSGSEENEAFFAATPCGTLDLSVLRPEVVALLSPGAEYYVSIEPSSGEWTQPK